MTTRTLPGTRQFRPLLLLAAAVAAHATATACATTTPAAVPAAATSPAAAGATTALAAPPGPVEPPPFLASAAPVTVEAAASARTEMRRAIFDAAWKTVRDKHYDKTLNGVDWNAARTRYEPLAVGAPSEAAFYRAMNQMIGELGQSHMMITGPGAADEDDLEEVAPPGEAVGGGAAPGATPGAAGGPGATPVASAHKPSADAVGDPGVTVRLIEGRPTVTRVRPRSAAERAGLLPGFIVTHIGGRPLRAVSDSSRPLRPVEERFAIRRAAQRRLLGQVGSRVTVRYLDNDDRPGQAVLVREEPPVAQVHLGHLPPLYPEVRIQQIGDVGLISFNIFLLQPVLEDIKRGIDSFRARHLRAVVLDLRGNPGGQGAMAIPIAARLVGAPLTLGTLHFREFSQTLVARPEMGVQPFEGPVAILTDEGSASASEILAAGLQEAKRAVVVGDATLGAVLPSVVEALPGGAVMQYVVADFKTPKGVMLEGRGVQPDRRVMETRAALRSGKDPVLDAALVAVRASRAR